MSSEVLTIEQGWQRLFEAFKLLVLNKNIMLPIQPKIQPHHLEKLEQEADVAEGMVRGVCTDVLVNFSPCINTKQVSPAVNFYNFGLTIWIKSKNENYAWVYSFEEVVHIFYSVLEESIASGLVYADNEELPLIFIIDFDKQQYIKNKNEQIQ